MRRLLDVVQKDIVNVWNMEDPNDVSDDSHPQQKFLFSLMLHRWLVPQKTGVPCLIIGVGRGSI